MSSSKALSAVDQKIYRNLLRIAKSLTKPFFFQQIPSPDEFQRAEGNVPSSLSAYATWMSGRKGSSEIHPSILRALSYCDVDRSRMLNKDKILDAIRYAFRHNIYQGDCYNSVRYDLNHSSADGHEDVDESADVYHIAKEQENGSSGEPGFEAIKMLSEQLNLSRVTSISSIGPEKVRTICSVVYAGDRSDYQKDNHFENGNIFFYRITIENLGENDIKVDGRSWRFEGDEDNEVFEISKFHPGLIGLTPTIKPGTSFHYMSNTKISSKSGTMQGSLHVQNLTTKMMFEVDVEKCPLIAH